MRRRLPLFLGLFIIAVMLLCAALPDYVAPYDPLTFDFVALQAPPSAAHWFGTDQFGRDVLSRTISAARIDLTIAVCGVIFPLLIGSAIGLICGWFGGWIDAGFGRLMDLVATFPFLVLVITFVAVLGPGLVNMFIALACVGWVSYARLMRGEVLVQKSADYVAAGRVLGYPHPRILLRHILPNAVRPVIAFAITDMALVILLGSSLGYLGMGAQPPTAEWGVLIADGKNFMTTAPWIALSPGIVIVLAGLGFSLAGDGLADLLEVRR
jgi:peptide/nickel transport system permease protein